MLTNFDATNSPSSRTVVKSGVAVKIGVFILIGIVAFFIDRFILHAPGLFFASSSPVDSVHVEQSIDLGKLAGAYQTSYRQIIGVYLGQEATIAAGDQATVSLTQQAKDALLALTVPPQFKDIHLQSIIILDRINIAATKSAPKDIAPALAELKKVATSID